MNLKEFKQLFFERLSKEYGDRADSLLQVAGRNSINDSRTSGLLEGLQFALDVMNELGKEPDSHKKSPENPYAV